jgi:hypothetical protein
MAHHSPQVVPPLVLRKKVGIKMVEREGREKKSSTLMSKI